MENFVSAFSIYSTQKQKRNKKKKNKQKTSLVMKRTFKDDTDDIILKRKKKKAPKMITKKCKKSKRIKENKVGRKHNLNSVQESDSEEIPKLIQVPPTPSNNIKMDDNCSLSSQDGFDFTPVLTNSVDEGLRLFKWMIAPFNPKDFFNDVWEKKPLHITRKISNYYKELISTPMIDKMLRSHNIQFTKNLDITSYRKGVRKTHNLEGRAYPHVVWDYYLTGCSIRLLNPQTYIRYLRVLNTLMQEYFHSFVGANAYLTPPDSQGFAPHYDDIEAFILQAEGKKRWRIYKPRQECERLPRNSSKNFKDDEIGSPIMEVTLQAGDMLYFPRGYIHQGLTIDGEHSLHVTVSMYQKNSWADLFERLMPAALQMTINDDIEFRKGIPLDLGDHFGVVHSDVSTEKKSKLEKHIHYLFDKIKNNLPIDEAVDEMYKKYQHDALPPVLTDFERAVTVFGDNDTMLENGKVINRVELSLDTRIRLLRKNILRLVSEDSIRVYYYMENSYEYHGNELLYLDIEEKMAPAIETLINSYPNYVAIEDLNIPKDINKLRIADNLWTRGIIMTEYPLPNLEDD